MAICVFLTFRPRFPRRGQRTQRSQERSQLTACEGPRSPGRGTVTEVTEPRDGAPPSRKLILGWRPGGLRKVPPSSPRHLDTTRGTSSLGAGGEAQRPRERGHEGLNRSHPRRQPPLLPGRNPGGRVHEKRGGPDGFTPQAHCCGQETSMTGPGRETAIGQRTRFWGGGGQERDLPPSFLLGLQGTCRH